jgi:putative membrane protein
MHKDASSVRLHGFLLISGLGILVWSGISPRDRLTWLMEVGPAIAGVVVLVATYRRFRLSDAIYVLIWVHAIVLMLGGHWTYAEMPVFNWLRDGLGLARNYYDRVGHLVQGFVPAILAREILLRTSPLRRGKWLSVLVVCVCLAISATYELIEWAAALLLGQSADAFLGTQGDVWDTQWDMFLCLVGSVAALATMRGLHDRSLGRLGVET